MKRTHAVHCLLLILIATFLLVGVAGAQVTVNTDIPGMTSNATGGTGICDTVFAFYNFALALGGVLALGAITYGGVKYTMAAGNPSGQSEGKAWVRDALLGLLLLAGAYMILNIINPDLTKCGLPDTLGQLPAPPADTVSTSTCPMGSLTTLTGLAVNMEHGTRVLFGSCDVNINKNLMKLKEESDKLADAEKSQ